MGIFSLSYSGQISLPSFYFLKGGIVGLKSWHPINSHYRFVNYSSSLYFIWVLNNTRNSLPSFPDCSFSSINSMGFSMISVRKPWPMSDVCLMRVSRKTILFYCIYYSSNWKINFNVSICNNPFSHVNQPNSFDANNGTCGCGWAMYKKNWSSLFSSMKRILHQLYFCRIRLVY